MPRTAESAHRSDPCGGPVVKIRALEPSSFTNASLRVSANRRRGVDLYSRRLSQEGDLTTPAGLTGRHFVKNRHRACSLCAHIAECCVYAIHALDSVNVPVSVEKTTCACIVGTRPEVIKMAPVIRALRRSPWATPFVIATGQQDCLLDRALDDFRIIPDHSIPYDPKGASLVPVLTAIASRLDDLFDRIKPDFVVAQGDTTSVFAASLAAFYRRIPFIHIEAGLRTGDLSAPFPEEFHRRAVAVSTTLHCAPTGAAVSNLLNEGVSEDRILMSGNTVIDALMETARDNPAPPAGFPHVARPILLTAHRRENFGEPLREALLAIRAFVDRNTDTGVFFPVHPNPAARAIARECLSNHDRIVLAEPASYPEIVGAMRSSWLVVTDSGGLQEEAPALGKPVLVLRNVTERPEAVAAGAVRVIGTSEIRVLQALTELYFDKATYDRMARPIFPYGDGHAAERIIAALQMQVAAPMSAEAHAAVQRHRGAAWKTLQRSS
jgi:UDP-N-acetylglucosamine 2-epimerase (non-hydrolysing)